MLAKIALENYTAFIFFDFKVTNSKRLNDTNVNNERILKGLLFISENGSGKTQSLQAIVLLLDFYWIIVNFIKNAFKRSF